MSGFLDEYGVSDERREKVTKRVVLALVVLLVAAGSAYFYFRNWREERQARQFVELLRARDYPAAYALWGCSPEHPCRDYPIEEFLKDWGPQSPHANLSALRLTRTRSCSGGIIRTLDFGGGEIVNLWIERRDRTIGFAPWEVCAPRMQVD